MAAGSWTKYRLPTGRNLVIVSGRCAKQAGGASARVLVELDGICGGASSYACRLQPMASCRYHIYLWFGSLIVLQPMVANGSFARCHDPSDAVRCS